MSLTEKGESYRLGKHLDYLEDKTGKLTLEQVLAPGVASRWKRSTWDTPNFGFKGTVHWFRVAVRNTTSTRRTWLLEIGYPMLDRVDCYVEGRAGSWERSVGGDRRPFHRRVVRHRNLVFRVSLDPGQTGRILLRVDTESSMQLPLRLWSRDGFLHKDHAEQAALWSYYGLVLVMALYNLFIFLSIRDRSYIYYVGYITGFVLFQMALNGVAFEVLWPNAVWWANHSVPVLLSLTLLFGCSFVRDFLDTRRVAPRFDLMVVILIVFTAVGFVYSLVGNYHIAIQWTTLSGLLTVILMLVVGFHVLRLGYRPARFFVLAWSLFLAGSVMYALKAFGVLPSVFITDYGMQIGNALEVVLLSFALADRINVLKAESEEAQSHALAVEREAKENLQQEVERQTGEIREANHQLQDLDRQRARFFQNISHELRTPLTVLLHPLDRLQHSEHLDRVPPELGLPDKLRAMERNTLRLLRLVNQLLDFSRLESGRTRLSYERRDMAELLEPIVEGFQGFARSKGLKLTFRVDGEMPEVFVDPEKLDTVVCNLVSNACKFTDVGGHVLVKVTSEPEHITIAVKDSGIGVAEEDQDRIFERFQQAQSELSRSFQGSGIGLSLARELVELTGGTLTLDSEVGFGSTFTVRLPLGVEHVRDQAQIRETPADEASPLGQRAGHFATALEAEVGLGSSPTEPPADILSRERPLVLVVEDNPDMRSLVTETCHEEFRVTEASNGERAMELLEVERPALVISDIMMPGMDGHELLTRMRATPEYQQIPVMLLTAKAGPGQRLAGLESGADEYLTKPFDSRELIARVRNLVRLRETERQLARLNAELQEEMTDQTAVIEQARTLQRFVPAALRRWLRRSQLNAVAAPGRAQLTIFHVRLRIPVSQAANLEVEDEVALQRSFLEVVLSAAESAEATVDRIQPGHVSGFFGAPEGQGVTADAKRAGALALELWERLDREEWTGDAANPMRPDVLITLHTGYGSAGTFGTQKHRAYTAIGSACHDAAALLQLEGRGVACTESTWLHLKDGFDGQPLGELLVMHRSHGMRIHRLAGEPLLTNPVDALARTLVRGQGTDPASLTNPTDGFRSLPTVLRPGAVVAERYRIETELGLGGMGWVFHARDEKLEQDVALKLIRPDFAADPARVARLKREVRLSRSITHPNVARIFDFDEWSGVDFISMELLRGDTLRVRLDADGAMPLPEVVGILAALCEGLVAAHEAKVLHRDLKPSNIMLEPQGRVVILDFGIARAVVSGDNTLSETGELVGTPQYMAPELVLGGAIGAATDLYALGAVAFEMLTGRPLFEADSILAVTYKQVAEAPPDPRELRPEIPEGLAAVVRRCLAKAPQERYASAREVAAALAALEI